MHFPQGNNLLHCGQYVLELHVYDDVLNMILFTLDIASVSMVNIMIRQSKDKTESLLCVMYICSWCCKFLLHV